jgi:cell division protein FtsN
MRAQLILNNLTNTTTDSIKTQNGTWHRVMVGPFTNRSKLEKARDTLASLNIQGLVKKIPVKN